MNLKRFRLSTLMLLVVIAALGVALVVQHRRLAENERMIINLQKRADSREEMLRSEILMYRQLVSEKDRASRSAATTNGTERPGR